MTVSLIHNFLFCHFACAKFHSDLSIVLVDERQ